MFIHFSTLFQVTQNPKPRRYNLLRNFSLVSISGFFLSVILLSTFYKNRAVRSLVVSTEESNVTLTNVIAKQLWPRYGQFMQSTKDMNDSELIHHPNIQDLYSEVDELRKDTSLVNIKIFDTKGRTIFSKDFEQLGANKSSSLGFKSAKQGEVLSQLNHRDLFNASQRVFSERYLLSSYIPIEDDQEIVAVFELYTDVTPLVRRIEKTQREIWLGSFVVLGSLSVVLNLFVKHANNTLKSQYEQLQYTKQELETINLELQELVKIDPLTQLFNRRWFMQQLEEEVLRSKSGSGVLSLIMLDVDYFKKYNDCYGHLAGDQCLITLAEIIRESSIKYGYLSARYGGEEFIILLANTPRTKAIGFAHELQQAIKLLAIPHAQSPISSFTTISLGIATVESCAVKKIEKLIFAADKALYTAKEQGRNQCTSILGLPKEF